jgi:UDP-2,3-diacylglucosamine pyrophosphatase LpxH
VRIDVNEDRLIVISDLHLGNPYSLANERLHDFLDHVIEGRFSLCINGDGLDILQSRFALLARQTLDIISSLRRLGEAGLGVYFVVGNHDVVLETVLSSWLGEFLSPFLNVRSGDARIRIEHGHLYDTLYVANPRLYEAAGAAAAPFLRIYPDVYRLTAAGTRLRSRIERRLSSRRSSAAPAREVEAATMIARRGFDAVVFGHTHRAEQVELPGGARYLNSGNWLRSSTFVEIVDGRATLQLWDPHRRVPTTRL